MVRATWELNRCHGSNDVSRLAVQAKQGFESEAMSVLGSLSSPWN